MNIAFDIDGVLSSFPKEMGRTISAYKAAANRVYIITGIEGPTVAKTDLDAKREYLMTLGVGRDMYDELIVCPEPHPANKSLAIQENTIEILFDNDKENIKAAAPYCVALLLWNSRE